MFDLTVGVIFYDASRVQHNRSKRKKELSGKVKQQQYETRAAEAQMSSAPWQRCEELGLKKMTFQ